MQPGKSCRRLFHFGLQSLDHTGLYDGETTSGVDVHDRVGGNQVSLLTGQPWLIGGMGPPEPLTADNAIDQIRETGQAQYTSDDKRQTLGPCMILGVQP